ncbi:hypothetical protein NUW54_g10398 [Trametes sanguinea]|uniref:Uncharacterized protein n=1 Tax=Trametes sanguinea TaxID=158606 RepID=A0ACC1P0M4_9APHY|nr:hypothetical protein NUW54_g10398 [Trametes sanguinea]
MGKKRSRASRAVRVVGPDDGPEGMNDGPPRKNFRSELYRTNAILEDKAQASQEFLMNLRGLDEATISAISAMRGEEAPSVNDPVSSAFAADDHGIPMDDGDGDWHDVDEDGVELSDDTMRELMEFRYAYLEAASRESRRKLESGHTTTHRGVPPLEVPNDV